MSKLGFRALLLGCLLIVSNLSVRAALLSADDAHFGLGALTIDTSSGLGWLDLSLSKDLSYQQMSLATQPGGAFAGYRYATVAEVQGLFAQASIDNGFQLEFSTGGQNISALISLLGATASQDARFETFGISGTPSDGGRVVMGLDFLFSAGEPGFQILGPPGAGPVYGETTSFSTVGNWLVQAVPEPTATALVLTGGLVLLNSRRSRRG